jgi:hypothetical protein
MAAVDFQGSGAPASIARMARFTARIGRAKILGISFGTYWSWFFSYLSQN